MNSNKHPVQKARRKRKLTLEELGHRSGVSMGCISRIETGATANPNKLTKRAIARALDVEVRDLWPRKVTR
jgi:DNA-binding XRE family transcriptional regulator